MAMGLSLLAISTAAIAGWAAASSPREWMAVRVERSQELALLLNHTQTLVVASANFSIRLAAADAVLAAALDSASASAAAYRLSWSPRTRPTDHVTGVARCAEYGGIEASAVTVTPAAIQAAAANWSGCIDTLQRTQQAVQALAVADRVAALRGARGAVRRLEETLCSTAAGASRRSAE